MCDTAMKNLTENIPTEKIGKMKAEENVAFLETRQNGRN